VEQHALLADVWETWGNDDFADKLKVLVPDEAQAKAFLLKLFTTMYRIDCRM
jgi:hypothetical protein